MNHLGIRYLLHIRWEILSFLKEKPFGSHSGSTSITVAHQGTPAQKACHQQQGKTWMRQKLKSTRDFPGQEKTLRVIKNQILNLLMILTPQIMFLYPILFQKAHSWIIRTHLNWKSHRLNPRATASLASLPSSYSPHFYTTMLQAWEYPWQGWVILCTWGNIQ
jgi:hypothetical protein